MQALKTFEWLLRAILIVPAAVVPRSPTFVTEFFGTQSIIVRPCETTPTTRWLPAITLPCLKRPTDMFTVFGSALHPAIPAIINKQGGRAEVFWQGFIVTLIEYSIAVVWHLQDADVVLQSMIGSIVDRVK